MIKLLFVCVTSVVAVIPDLASDQLYIYKNNTSRRPIRILTSSNGAPVHIQDTVNLNTELLSNEFLMDLLAHNMEERIPERTVHAKGAGAFGYFQVTHDVTKYCKAKLFSKIGKKTPVFVRFSQSSLDKGEPDSVLDSRGFATKFYTEEGNFDIVGFHTPMFLYKEPILGHTIGKVIRRNPVTNLRDPNMLWDFITLRHESINFFIYLFGRNGIPYGYRRLPGFSVHTYHVYNKFGKSYFVRFHILPDDGIQNLSTEEAVQLMLQDPDYAVRDLYNAIENGKWPCWTVYLQVLTKQDIKNAKFDVFDITKQLPVNDYPLIPCGKLVLNRNPKNYFADVEQAAFCPGNLVPGILGGPDKAFISRRFAYKDTQRHRLGVNFNRIPVNCPLSMLNVYDRDGAPPVYDNGGSAPNYYPNSFHGPRPVLWEEGHRPSLINITQYETEADNFQQVREYYRSLSYEDRNILVQNIVFWSLSKANVIMQQRAVQLFRNVHSDLAERLQTALEEYAASVE